MSEVFKSGALEILFIFVSICFATVVFLPLIWYWAHHPVRPRYTAGPGAVEACAGADDCVAEPTSCRWATAMVELSENSPYSQSYLLQDDHLAPPIS